MVPWKSPRGAGGPIERQTDCERQTQSGGESLPGTQKGRGSVERVETKIIATRVWDSSQTLKRSHYSVRARPRETERD